MGESGEVARQGVPRFFDAYGIFKLGRRLEYLRETRVGDQVAYQNGSIEKGGHGFILMSIENVLNLVEKYQLAGTMHRQVEGMTRRFEEKYVKGGGRTIDEADLRELSLLVAQVLALTEQALQERWLVELTPGSGALNYERLLREGVRGLFPDAKLAERVPAGVVEDLGESVRSLAYGTTTASVMMSLRAVEGMLGHVFRTLSRPGDAVESGGGERVSLEALQKLMMMPKTGATALETEGYLGYVKAMRGGSWDSRRRFSVREAEDLLIMAQHAISSLQALIDEGPPRAP